MSQSKTKKPTICIAGISGFIGESASRFFTSNGYLVKPITRLDLKTGSDHVASIINHSEMVLNLAGAPIQKKWTKLYKEVIYSSRINTTQTLVKAIKLTSNKPSVFISTSAVGIYNSIDIHDEFSDKYSNSFLGKVCRDWENEAFKLLNTKETRLIIFRFGVVLGKNRGAFPSIFKPFKFFAGSRLGDGYQWFPYVHIDDVLSAFWFVLVNKNARGIYNLVVPNLISYNKFCHALAKVAHRPYWLQVPRFILKLMYGEATQILLEGQHVKPHRLIREGFYFQYPTELKTIISLIGRNKK